MRARDTVISAAKRRSPGALGALLAAGRASAQTDEIQVYTGEIADPGELAVMLHANYTPAGHETAAFPGGVVPDHALNAVPELALGVTGWAELGLYLPVFTVAPGEGFRLDAVKLRALLVTPRAEERRLSYGVNLELGYSAPHWDPSRWSGEARFILAGRLGRVELALNPILDTAFDGLGAMELVPATRLGWRLSERWTVAVEEYASLGRLDAIAPLARQAHTLFAVVGHDGELADVELGIGCGLTDAADRLVLKRILP